ncbi:MAG: alanyl-tRNA editing protein [Candidatus Eiseniibacteriota bacterium]
MSSERLDYDDAYTTTFTARIAHLGEHQGRPAIELESTFFYPESGGQLADRGTVGAWPVLDVQAEEGGRIWHVLEAAASSLGEFEARIDWARRFDHMQQHTGQHILSAAFERLLDAATLSSTLGAEKSVIEVDLNEADWNLVDRIEAAANAVVWEDREIVRHWVDDEGVRRFQLRKPPAVTGRIRIVEIPDWDVSACGGTHTRHTGEVGVIKVMRWERVRGRVRFEFLCGARALRDHAWRNQALLEAARRCTLSDRDLIAHLERAAEERDALKRRLRELTAVMIGREARAAVGSPPRGVASWFDSRPREELRLFVNQCLEAGAPWVIACAGEPESALIVARAKGAGADLKRLLPALLETARGKGGGSPDTLQISAADAGAARAAYDLAAREVPARMNAD